MHDTTTPTDQAVILDNLTIDLTAMAVRVGAAVIVGQVFAEMGHPQEKAPELLIEAWTAMTGLERDQALALADYIVAHRDQVTAAVVPW